VLDAEHRTDRRAGDEVVDHARLVPIDEQMPDVVALDDREQPPECADECFSAADRVVPEGELGIGVEQRGQSFESPFANGLDVRRYELAGIGGHLNLPARKMTRAGDNQVDALDCQVIACG